jgi:hypothetical protein
MACGCNKSKQQFEVVTADSRIVYTTSSESTAKSVAQRYEGSTVRPKGQKDAGAAT